MDITGDHSFKKSKPDSERQCHVFPHMVKVGLKDKCIHKYTYDLIHIYIERERERERT
jgi:hypothetical protein